MPAVNIKRIIFFSAISMLLLCSGCICFTARPGASGVVYGGVLITALALTVLADIYFIQAFRRGGFAARCFSVLLLIPTLFVVADFVRRAPYSF